MANRVFPGPRLLGLLLPALLLLTALPASALEPIKSPNDDLDYEYFVLPNQLRVLLISDPDTDKAAASLDVNIGSASDPEDRQGLAHYLEHMLFLGTGKYPEPGEYKQFLSAHGGNHNAYTALEHTNYFFDVDAGFLAPALDRFAQFFIAPLFTERYVANEREVVHSEYQSKLGSDGWRIRSAQRQAMNPAHPAARFNIGSRETLVDRPGDPVREDLIAFYEQHYSADLMTLAVLGREPLAQLRTLIEQRFAAVPDRDAEPLAIDVPRFAPDTLPARLDVVTLKPEQNLTLSFPVPPIREHFDSKPLSYIANLLGHEGEGSLLELLKQRGWADSLWAGASESSRSDAVVSVSISLTDAGLDRVDAIVDRVFQQLRLIREHDIERWRFEEQQRMAEIAFRFQEPSSPLSRVRSLAAALHDYPPREVLRGPYLMERFEPALIRDYLDRLRPDKLLLTVSAPERDTDAVEPHFQVPYRLRPVPAETVAEWRDGPITAELRLPEPNPFIPEELALKPLPGAPAGQPEVILAQPGLTLWHQQDAEFRVPRAEFYVSVRSPLANDSARHAVLTRLYLRLVEEQLGTFTYPAYLAGLDFRLYRHIRGFTLRISGYDPKQPLLLERMVETLREPDIDPAVFERLKADVRRGLDSARLDPPYRQALSEVTDLLLMPHWTVEQQLAALEPLGSDDVAAFAPRLLERLELLVLAYGNLTAEEARAMSVPLRERLLADAEPVEVPRGEVLQLARSRDYTRQLTVDNSDSAVVVYFQGPDRDVDSRARYALLAEVLESPFFEQLRTEQRLGYIVFASGMPILEVPGLAFVVQSPDADPGALEGHVERFLQAHLARLETLDEAELERFKASLRSRILEPHRTLQARADEYWTELDRPEPRFDTRQRVAEAVAALDKAELIAAYRDMLLGEQRRRLVVRATGNGHEPATGPATAELIGDVVEFRAGLEQVPAAGG